MSNGPLPYHCSFRSYLLPRNSLVDLLERMRPRMQGQRRTGQHHVIVAYSSRIGQLSADPGRGIHVDSTVHHALADNANRYTSYKSVRMDWSAHRSIHVPGILAPTLRVAKPLFSNTAVYQGLRPADRRRTLPPVFKARWRACTWLRAWES